MKKLLHKTPPLAMAFALVLVAGCDNDVTAPKQMHPSDQTAAGKAVAKSVIALEPLPGSTGSYSAARGINDLGQVVGESSYGSGVFHAVIWNNSTVPQDLGTLPSDFTSSAVAISSDGRMISGISTGATALSAVRWLRLGEQWLIDALPSGSGCTVNGMSSDGTAIAGTCGLLAVVWVNGSRIVLGNGNVSGVNSKGQAVGAGSSFNHAILWDFSSGVVTETDLGTLGGTFAVATNINEAGEVTGWSENANQVSHAFLWTPKKGVMIDLAPNGPTSGGYGINASGKVVGDMFPSTQHAGYYDGHKAIDLGFLPGYTSAIAVSLNNNGQAVGWSSTASFLTRATMWIVK
jgi:probable HAF family extracellular repeat protein